MEANRKNFCSLKGENRFFLVYTRDGSRAAYAAAYAVDQQRRAAQREKLQ